MKPTLCMLLTALLMLLCTQALAGSADAVWPEPGGIVEVNGKMQLDLSHLDKGYVLCCVAEQSKHKFMARVTLGKGKLNYELSGDGTEVVLPLQMGSGKYEIALFENVKGNKYAAAGQLTFEVQLADQNAPFLVTNQYVDYNRYTAAVLKSDELCGDMAPGDKYRAIIDYISQNYGYDFARAKKIKAGELPNIDYCYESKMGICQHLSAMMCCMLRVQGIPCKLVIGYADKYYHAWTVAVMNGEEMFFDPTESVGALYGIKKYKQERVY